MSIVNELMSRDGITFSEASDLVEEARGKLYKKLASGEDCYNFCEDEFGLEPDFLEELLP